MKTLKPAEKFFLILSALALVTLLIVDPANILTGIIPAAVITSGILGGGRNKVGPVVMSKWKGIDYIKSYAVPANPNTSAQQAVRSKFAQLVLNARQLLSSVLKPFWDPFYSDKSGFNAFISENYSKLDTNNRFQLTSVISKGTLEGAPIDAAAYNPTTGALSIDWNGTTSGNGLSSDSVFGVVYDKGGKNFVAASYLDERSAVNSVITIPTGLTSTNLILYLFAYRGSGGSLMVSDSTSYQLS